MSTPIRSETEIRDHKVPLPSTDTQMVRDLVEKPIINQGVPQRGPDPQTPESLQSPPTQSAGPGNLTPEERAARKAFLVSQMERGVLQDRLHVKLPPHLHGEWVRRDEQEINRMKTYGFQIDETYAPNQALQDDGTRGAVIADVVFMTTDRVNKELIDEIRLDQFYKINGRPGDVRAATKEEKDYVANTRNDTGGDIPTMSESRNRPARVTDIVSAVNVQDNQTRPSS